MITRLSRHPLLLACALFAAPCVSQAQTEPATSTSAIVAPTAHEAPIYDSADNANRQSSSRFASPEDDARPGEYYFGLAVQAVKKNDYSFAVNMYKVAASWAYKPAEYNLGVMYAQGSGVKQDLPRAMAWLTLAAERNDQTYVAARDLVNSKLSDAQFNQANVIFAELKPTYGDDAALVRAKARWAQVRAGMTGSRVGSLAGNLKVGGAAPGQISAGASGTPSGALKHVSTGTGEILSGSFADGSIAYQQLVSSDNPYDPKFAWRPGQQTVTVGPLTSARKGESKPSSKPATAPKDTPANDHPR